MEEGCRPALPEVLEGVGVDADALVLVLAVAHLAAGDGVDDARLRAAQARALPPHLLHHLVALVGRVESLARRRAGRGGAEAGAGLRRAGRAAGWQRTGTPGRAGTAAAAAEAGRAAVGRRGPGSWG